jgi:hypothetical protein
LSSPPRLPKDDDVIARRTLASLIGLALAASVTGCATRSGAAAVIDGSAIPDREIAAVVQESEGVLAAYGAADVAGDVALAPIALT